MTDLYLKLLRIRNHQPSFNRRLTYKYYNRRISQLDHNHICFHLYNKRGFFQDIVRDPYGDVYYDGMFNDILLEALRPVDRPFGVF